VDGSGNAVTSASVAVPAANGDEAQEFFDGKRG